MNRILLHIGRHKSGTTTLQKFLCENTDLLASRDFYYPEYGKRRFAHHDIGERINRRSLRLAGESGTDIINELRQGLVAEIGNTRKMSIISSEAFQNCDPSVVASLFDGYQIDVVVYLREQVEYFISAYAQKVHATAYSGSMEDFYENVFFYDYQQFLSQWQSVFGSRLHVRLFDRESLIESDIVQDFAQTFLDMSADEIRSQYAADNANPTLSPRMLAYKLGLNRSNIDVPLRGKLYKRLGELSDQDNGGPIAIPATLATRIKNDCEEINRQVANRYFNKQKLFNHSRFVTGDLPTLTPSSMAAITQTIYGDNETSRDLLQQLSDSTSTPEQQVSPAANTKRIAYSCFVDAREKFEREAKRWTWSLIENLGVDPEDIYITCHSNVSADFKQTLELLGGINVEFTEPLTSVSPPANKWRQLATIESNIDKYTHVVISDCDKVFVSFSPDWCDDSIRACKFVPRPTFSTFETLFSHYLDSTPRFVLDKPDPQDPSNDPRNYVNNHNGGLLLIPASKLSRIALLWRRWIDTLLETPDLLGKNLRNLDQVAFALAMHSLEEDINFLPKSLDLGPNINAVSPYILHPDSGQLVLHIHGSDDDYGRIVPGANVPAEYARLIDDLNTRYMSWSRQAIAA